MGNIGIIHKEIIGKIPLIPSTSNKNLKTKIRDSWKSPSLIVLESVIDDFNNEISPNRLMPSNVINVSITPSAKRVFFLKNLFLVYVKYI